MLPLEALPTSDVAGIFTDIDGTLTDDTPRGGILSTEGYAALVDAVDAGLRVVPVTGRAAGFGEVLAMLWPVPAVIVENGALAILRDGTRVYWDDDVTRAEQRRRLDALAAEALAMLPFARLADDNHLRRIDVAFDIGERERLSPGQIDELTALMHARGARSLCSTIHAHAFFGDHDKARMLDRLAGVLWSEDAESVGSRYVFVGDSPNDQAGFARFPRSVGVANVARYAGALDPPPAFVTPSPGGRGFAELVRHLLRGR